MKKRQFCMEDTIWEIFLESGASTAAFYWTIQPLAKIHLSVEMAVKGLICEKPV